MAVPLAHSLGLNGVSSGAASLAARLFVVSCERFTPEAVFAAVETSRDRSCPAVATIFRRLLNSPAVLERLFRACVWQCRRGALSVGAGH